MLLNRKGFVKIAVEQGLDGGIIPVYHFGNTQVRHMGRTHSLTPSHACLHAPTCWKHDRSIVSDSLPACNQETLESLAQ